MSSTVPTVPAGHDPARVVDDAAPAAVVLLPGLAGHPDEFTAQVRHLSRTRLVLALIPTTGVDLSVEGRARAVVEAAARAGLGSYVVVGHSTNGMVALELAARGPDAVRGAVVLDSPLLLPAPLRALRRLPLAMLRTPLARPLLRAFFAATFTDSDPVRFRADVLARLQDTPDRECRWLTRTTFTYDSQAALSRARVPVLVVRANIPVDLAKLPEHVEAVDVPGVRHWPHVHAAAQVSHALDTFLADVDHVSAPARPR